MAVAGGHDGDAGGEIEEAVAIHVFHYGALAFARHQRIAARIRWRHHLGVASDHGPRARAREWPLENRQVRTGLLQRRGHGNNSFSVLNWRVEGTARRKRAPPGSGRGVSRS